MTITELLEKKKSQVTIYRNDLVEESDAIDWRKKHPLGPVHVQIACKLCGDLLADDLPEYGHYGKDSFWASKLLPHFVEKHG